MKVRKQVAAYVIFWNRKHERTAEFPAGKVL